MKNEWYSAKHPLVLEGIHGTGDIVLLEGMTSKGEFFFKNPPSALYFLLQVAGMDSMERSKMRRWIVLVGPLTEGKREGMCSQSLSKGIWSSWKSDSDLNSLDYKPVMVCLLPQKAHESMEREMCPCALPPVKEIPVCAPHTLRCE